LTVVKKEIKRIFLNTIFKNKVRKIFVLSSCFLLIIALCYFEKTKRIAQYGLVYHHMGSTCDGKCGQDKKLKYFQEAVYHNPNLSAAHYQLALIYEKKGEHRKALEYFARVTKLDHTNILAFYRVGVKYFKEGAYEYALRYFLQALRGGGGNPEDIQYYLARIYDQRKEYDLAIQNYRNIVRSNPKYADEVYPRLVEICLFLNKDQTIVREVIHLQWEDRHDLADQLEATLKAAKASEVLKNERK